MSFIKAHFDGTSFVLDEPLPSALEVGQSVRVIIEPAPESQSAIADDLVAAANSSTDFWDNPYDDEDWNGH
jgi:hypothetical protein